MGLELTTVDNESRALPIAPHRSSVKPLRTMGATPTPNTITMNTDM